MVDGRKVTVGFAAMAIIGAIAFGGYRFLNSYGEQVVEMRAVGEPALIALAEQDWNAAALRAFADSSLNEALDRAASQTPFEQAKLLGKVQRVLKAMSTKESYMNGRWLGVVQERVQFEKGTGIVTFSLAWSSRAWRLAGLHVKPEVGKTL